MGDDQVAPEDQPVPEKDEAVAAEESPEVAEEEDQMASEDQPVLADEQEETGNDDQVGIPIKIVKTGQIMIEETDLGDDECVRTEIEIEEVQIGE